MFPVNPIKDQRGVATSLLEVILVIAIVAILSTVALVAALDNIEHARLSRAIADTEQFGIAIHSFMQDTGFPPAFKAGDARGPDDAVFKVLHSEGDEPAIDESLHWPTEAADRDLIENHLVKNRPHGDGTRYPRAGEISWARYKGWNGPYMAKVPVSDPWNDKYLINIQMLTPKGIQLAGPGFTLESGQHAAVFVISAGPNRTLETRFDQTTESFVQSGDDILYRIQ